MNLETTASQREERTQIASSYAAACLLHAGALALIFSAPEQTRLLPTLHSRFASVSPVIEVVQMPAREAPDPPITETRPPEPPSPERIQTPTRPEPQTAEAPKAERPEPKRPPKRHRSPRRAAKAPAPIAAGSAEGAPEVTGDSGPAVVEPVEETADGPVDAEPPETLVPATAAPEPAPGVDLGALARGYAASVGRALQRDFEYPASARRRGMEGTVIVRLTIDEAGNILEVQLHSSSGHDVLDRAAIRAAQSIRRVPPPPRELGWARRPLEVPFVYVLDRGA